MSTPIKPNSNIIYKNIDDLPLVFSPEVLCNLLDISKNTAYDMIKNSDFPAKRVGNKIFIYKDSFIKWLE